MRGVARAGWVAGVAALSLALTACGGGDGESEPAATEAAGGVEGGSVTINGCDPENPFIPSNTNETCGGNIIDAITTGLVEYEPENAKPYNAVAEEFATEDNQVWTITLKDGFTFHDGTPVTAQSFVDAWNWAAYGPNAQLNSYFFGPDGAGIQGFTDVQGEDANGDEVITEDEAPVTEMSGLKAVDDLTLEVTLDAPFAIFPTVVGYSAFAPLPESFFDDPDAYGKAPIGNGPVAVSRSGSLPVATTPGAASPAAMTELTTSTDRTSLRITGSSWRWEWWSESWSRGAASPRSSTPSSRGSTRSTRPRCCARACSDRSPWPPPTRLVPPGRGRGPRR